jgi:hypothetical protein
MAGGSQNVFIPLRKPQEGLKMFFSLPASRRRLSKCFEPFLQTAWGSQNVFISPCKPQEGLKMFLSLPASCMEVSKCFYARFQGNFIEKKDFSPNNKEKQQ